ncbi:MAG: 30S ribosomal protein S3 [Proteobacteria bacterium]|nr:MAG: 30S ribosomal protein S3 [Pseudomonadota bacterium]
MGQKTNPIGFRLGITRTWDSRWFAKRNYAELLHEDLMIRKVLKKKLYQAGVSKIEIERAANKVKVNIFSARPGLIIGKKGSGVDSLRAEVQSLTKNELLLNVLEVRKPEIDATLVSESIGAQLEKRVAFRRAMKKAMATAIKMGVRGIKVRVSGRLGGAEIARTEGYSEGSIPLHTLRADIDYGTAEARTTYGVIGIKTWIYKGDVPLRKTNKAGAEATTAQQNN